MRLTLGELHQIYDQAWHTYVNKYDVGGEAYVEAEQAAIAAVVRVLRDEMMREFERCDSCSGIEHVEPFFDEILGDAGDEVAGVSVGNGETELDRTSGPAPATDPAPAERSDATAVCEITAERDRLKAALEAIAIKAGLSECGGDYVAAVTVIGDIEQMADKALGGDA